MQMHSVRLVFACAIFFVVSVSQENLTPSDSPNKAKSKVESSRRHDTSPNLRDIAAKSRSAQRGTVKKASPA